MTTAPSFTRSLDSVDQRKSSRVYLRRGGVPVICQHGSQVLLSKANALGMRGAFVFTSNPFPVGSVFTLELGFAPKIQVDARVRSAVSSVGMGVEFITLDNDSKSRLVKWMDTARVQQREECA
jgi:hypothetical protein